MDGVIYRGTELIPGADKFVARLRREKIPFRFLTNNSQRTRRDVALKLCRLGLKASADDVFTCSMATARFLARQKPGATAFVIGENGLAAALHQNNIAVVDDDADYVVVGEGRAFNFEMIERAVRLIEKGARLIATNPDATCPTEAGTRPGCGAIVAMLEKATGREAFSVGKPSGVMMRMAQDELGVSTRHIVMVGDTMETDILGGVGMGYRTVLVLSGHTTVKHLEKFAYRPDFVIKSVKYMPEEIFNTREALADAVH
jgi:NagD protein